MTRSNLSHIEKVPAEKNDSSRKFWGTIGLSVISILLATYFTKILLQQPKTLVVYVGLVVFLSAATVSAISLFFTVRNRQSLGIQILFFATNLLGIVVIGLFQGRAPTSSFTILALSALMIVWLLPNHLKRSYTMIAAAAFILMWVIEWINPFWRIQLAVAAVGPVAGIVFIVFLLAIVIRQAWARISLRWKIGGLVTVLLLGVVAVGYSGYVGLQSLRYQLSNIYDFMLVPIVSINNADAALADAQIKMENLDEVKRSEVAGYVDEINAANKLTQDIITRYDTEWVTTTSPEFTAALRQGGKLDLQYQEVATLNIFHTAFNMYLFTSQQYIQSVQAGGLDQESAAATAKNLQEARQSLQELIAINNQFADFANAQAQSAFQSALVRGILVLGLSLVVGIIVSYLIVASLLSRLGDLTQFATAAQQGNLTQQIVVTWNDEISVLGNAFNAMTSQLQGSFATLEQRVAARTHNLELAAEVGRAVSQVRDLDVMLKDACNLILKEFDLYYVQVYLTDPSQTKLMLEAGTGTVGAQLTERGHNLPFDTTSINGRAAVEKHTVLISDTSKSTTFRQNPLLPETRGEMAVPLIVANKVVGVLDMQSSRSDVLTQEVLPAFEALAGQLAVAVQNSSLLAETEEARAEVEKQARRLVRTAWDEHLDAIHKPEQIGYVFKQNEITTLMEAEENQTQDGNKAVTAPIAVAGESLGSLVVEMGVEGQNEQVAQLVNMVAHQVSQQIENLRLLERAERYQTEAEQAARRQHIEGWQDFIASRAGQGLAYLYDTKEVHPRDNVHVEDTSMYALPIKARDEMIGKLSVEGLTGDDQESVELINAVAERLSTHIENLRLFEQTQVSLAETQTLYRINEAISGETELDAIYQTVARLSCDELGFSGSWIAAYEPKNETLRGVAGINIPEERMRASLPISQNTPATLAAQKRQLVTINHPEQDERMADIPLDVRAKMGKALSMPVMIGQELLGVIAVTRSESAVDIGVREERMLQAVAIQLAIVMQRIKLFEQVQKQANRESMLNTINQKIQSATSVEAVLQIAARELGHALGAPLTIAQIGLKESQSGN